ncbi:hypothetical protein NLB25_27795, partial [Klebsiella pneumoniae]|nr:hypothetical protein [Klebsiella pneumoniae]
SLVAGADSPAASWCSSTAVTVPYPWHYWLTVSPQAENRPEVSLVAGADSPAASWCSSTAVTVPYPWHYWLTVSP